MRTAGGGFVPSQIHTEKSAWGAFRAATFSKIRPLQKPLLSPATGEAKWSYGVSSNPLGSIPDVLRLCESLQDRGALCGYQSLVPLKGLEWRDGEENLLDQLHRAWAGRRFHPTPLVGAGRNHPHCVCQLVDRLPQRLVLNASSFCLLATSTWPLAHPPTTARSQKLLFSTTPPLPAAAFSSADVPTTIGRDSGAHSLQ
jgi:hypothetical protein